MGAAERAQIATPVVLRPQMGEVWERAYRDPYYTAHTWLDDRGRRAWFAMAPGLGSFVDVGPEPEEDAGSFTRRQPAGLVPPLGAGAVVGPAIFEGHLVRAAAVNTGRDLFAIFDLLRYRGMDLRGETLADRLAYLRQAFTEMRRAGCLPAAWQLVSMRDASVRNDPEEILHWVPRPGANPILRHLDSLYVAGPLSLWILPPPERA